MSTAANHTTRASHSSSVPAVEETSYLRCPEGRIGYDVAGAGSLVVLVPGMADLRAGYRFPAPALRAAGYRVACTDLRGHGDSDTTFASYGDEETAADVIASLRRPGHAKVFSATTRTSHDLAEARLADVTAPALVVVGEQDPDFPDPRAEADWIARALGAQVVTVPEAGHYPQSQRPDITTGAALRFLESVTGGA
jgi:pimeloyl-ACP methyl ester carboxylesterase